MGMTIPHKQRKVVHIMEKQIQDLVDSIRKEGLEEADRQKTAILEDARKEAGRLVKEAQEKAGAMIEEARRECSLLEQSTKASLEQAARDVSITLHKSINDELGRILSASIGASMDKDLLKELVMTAVKSGFSDAEVEVKGADADALVKALAGQLATELKAGLSLKASSGVNGLRISSKDGSGYVDLSPDELSALLMPHLSQSVRALIG